MCLFMPNFAYIQDIKDTICKKIKSQTIFLALDFNLFSHNYL